MAVEVSPAGDIHFRCGTGTVFAHVHAVLPQSLHLYGVDRAGPINVEIPEADCPQPLTDVPQVWLHFTHVESVDAVINTLLYLRAKLCAST